jgi:hypothetical protein
MAQWSCSRFVFGTYWVLTLNGTQTVPTERGLSSVARFRRAKSGLKPATNLSRPASVPMHSHPLQTLHLLPGRQPHNMTHKQYQIGVACVMRPGNAGHRLRKESGPPECSFGAATRCQFCATASHSAQRIALPRRELPQDHNATCHPEAVSAILRVYK